MPHLYDTFYTLVPVPLVAQAFVSIVALATLVSVCSYFDRLIGSGVKGRTGPVLQFTGYGLAVGIVAGLPLLATLFFAVCFPLWRTPGFAHNVITPTNSKEAQASFLRHFIFSLPFLLPLYLAGAPLLYLAFALGCIAWFGNEAKTIAQRNAKTLSDGIDRNEWAEKTRGSKFGLAIAASYAPFALLTVFAPEFVHNRIPLLLEKLNF
ncbi:membrane hypothetical protein [Gammaproteobacteria bacterium]